MTCTVLRRFAVSALLIATSIGVASAADMPVKAPNVAPVPAFDWNGFYVGVYAGAAWMDQATTSDPCSLAAAAFCAANGTGIFNGVPPATYDMGSSFTGGGTIGYNWQPTPYTLIGQKRLRLPSPKGIDHSESGSPWAGRYGRNHKARRLVQRLYSTYRCG
jgi:opacity protein-like surface antigen